MTSTCRDSTRRAGRRLPSACKRGMGLIMIGGYHSFGPGGFRRSPLADVLPIADRTGRSGRSLASRCGRTCSLPGPLRMRPAAPLGMRHPVMQLEGSGVGGQGIRER